MPSNVEPSSERWGASLSFHLCEPTQAASVRDEHPGRSSVPPSCSPKAQHGGTDPLMHVTQATSFEPSEILFVGIIEIKFTRWCCASSEAGCTCDPTYLEVCNIFCSWQGIPDIVHFVYGLGKNASFGFVHLAAIKSAISVCGWT